MSYCSGKKNRVKKLIDNQHHHYHQHIDIIINDDENSIEQQRLSIRNKYSNEKNNDNTLNPMDMDNVENHSRKTNGYSQYRNNNNNESYRKNSSSNNNEHGSNSNLNNNNNSRR